MYALGFLCLSFLRHTLLSFMDYSCFLRILLLRFTVKRNHPKCLLSWRSSATRVKYDVLLITFCRRYNDTIVVGSCQSVLALAKATTVTEEGSIVCNPGLNTFSLHICLFENLTKYPASIVVSTPYLLSSRAVWCPELFLDSWCSSFKIRSS